MARFFRKRLAEKLNRDGFLIRNLVSFHRKYDRSEEIDSRMIFIFLKFEILWKGKREKLGEEMQSSHTPSFNADARNFLSFFSFFFFLRRIRHQECRTPQPGLEIFEKSQGFRGDLVS